MERKASIVRFWLVAIALALIGLWEPSLWFGVVPLFVFPGCTCCECITHKSDDFSTDTLATDYDTRSGTFTVSGGVLTTSSAGALLIANATGDGHGHVSAKGKVTTSGGTFRVVGSYTDDNNYLFGEVTVNGASSTLKLWNRSSGSDTQIGSTCTFTGATSTFYTVVLCWNGSSASAAIPATCGATGAYSGTGTKAGIGTTPGGTTTFDDFAFTQHRVDKPSCPGCEVPCGTCCGPTHSGSFQFVQSGVANGSCSDCANMNGTWIIAKSTDCVWTSTLANFTLCGFATMSHLGSIEFACDDSSDDPIYYVEASHGVTIFPGTPMDAVYRHEFSAQPECDDITSLSLAFVSASAGNCNFSSSSLVISAV